MASDCLVLSLVEIMNTAECNKNNSNVIKMPKKENQGSSFIENEFFEAVAKNRIPGEQMQVLSAIIRKTWCWKKEKDKIPTSQIIEYTGLKKPLKP